MLYEVHITYPQEPLGFGWKELIIELDKGDTPIQPMYSKYLERECLHDLLTELSHIEAERIKIERYKNIPDFIEWPEYYEYHIKIHTNELDIQVEDIGAKLSKNAQKDGRFITLRGYYSRSEVEARFSLLKMRIKEKGYSFSNIQKELVVYDSNVNLDKGW